MPAPPSAAVEQPEPPANIAVESIGVVPGAQGGSTAVAAKEPAALAAALGVPLAAAVECAASPLFAGWTVADFVSAVNGPKEQVARRPALEAALVDGPSYASWFTTTAPATRPCPAITRIGAEGDGGKRVCHVDSLKEGCTVFSIGSNNEWSFETGVLATTPCSVHTFDCTIDESKVQTAGPRNKFSHTCLGPPAYSKPDAPFALLNDLVKQQKVPRVDFMKADIECWEYDMVDVLVQDALADWAGSYASLPAQLSLEIHASAASGAVAGKDRFLILFEQLVSLGYVIISTEANGDGGCCWEFTFVRIPAGCWKQSPLVGVRRTPGGFPW